MNLRFILGLLCLPLAACDTAITSQMPTGTICSISKADEGRVIRITAVYETDLRHGALLSDAQCPGASIGIGFDADGTDGTLKAFDEALYAAPFKPGMIQAKVDITGKVERDPSNPSARPEFRRIRLNSFKVLPR